MAVLFCAGAVLSSAVHSSQVVLFSFAEGIAWLIPAYFAAMALRYVGVLAIVAFAGCLAVKYFGNGNTGALVYAALFGVLFRIWMEGRFAKRQLKPQGLTEASRKAPRLEPQLL
ncbi:hypothetical protein NGM99_06085 [Mesorhizobium sp. RP14(2022)]|uniref:Uncharacterized protein n=1 Tax=Mesorhizobium liriopis TaxID=2953882 RepID=A0ABT1C5V3_9HYPH|nr:hypothetical protein [Mesorhizobium liriopis]MCO6049356.1 hypothetical protein [Mesorhizobium liriopis]